MDQSSLFTTSSTSTLNQSVSLFSQFRDINSRLKSKTRSLIPSKKVNLSDVSDQFVALGRDLSVYNKSYDAVCHLAAAKTQRLIPNSVNSEFQHLMQAARSFRDAAMKFDGSFDEQNRQEIHNAISCYRLAIKLCHQSQLNVLHHELGSMYERIGSFGEAAACFMDASSFRDAGHAFIKANDHFSAISAFESIPESEKNNNDLVMSFLLKLSANQVHVLKLIESGNSGDDHQGSTEKRNDMRRMSSININDTHVAIRFPVIPLVIGGVPCNASKADKSIKHEDEVMLMSPDVLSLNIALESLYYFLRDYKNVNSVSEKVTNSLDLEDEEDDRKSDQEDEEEDEENERNEENLIRMRLLNELFARIRDQCQRKIIHDLLMK